jgi:uncharacterized protein YdbL (DUF1318 family)
MAIFRILFVALSLMLAGSVAAQAQTGGVASLQQAGVVGERPDGLLAPVSENAGADVINIVNEVNAQRMAEYRKIAADTDAPLQAVQQRAGAQLIARLPKGQYFMDAAGRWRQK